MSEPGVRFGSEVSVPVLFERLTLVPRLDALGARGLRAAISRAVEDRVYEGI